MKRDMKHKNIQRRGKKDNGVNVKGSKSEMGSYERKEREICTGKRKGVKDPF